MSRIPDLIFEYPMCPLCDRTTEHDGDGFYCDPCKVWWPPSGSGDEAYRTEEPCA